MQRRSFLKSVAIASGSALINPQGGMAFAAESEQRFGDLLNSIEQLRGRHVTAEDEATWEAKIDFKPSVEARKKRLHIFLDAYAGGAAGADCGAMRHEPRLRRLPYPFRLRLIFARRQLDCLAVEGDGSQGGAC